MALSATLRRFAIAVSDSDRGVYGDLDLRAAQHPSESTRYLVARVLARVFEDGEGVEFSKGLSAADEPAILQHDLQGTVTRWIEVGSPSLDRLHRASKSGPKVVVYAWKNAEELAREVVGVVYKAEQLEIYALDYKFLDAVAEQLNRNNQWSLAVSGGALYLEIAGTLYEGSVTRIPIPT